MNLQKSSVRKKWINSLSTTHTITLSSYNLELSPHGTLKSTLCPLMISRFSTNTSTTIFRKDSFIPLSLHPLYQFSSSRKQMENYASVLTIKALTRSQSRITTPYRSSTNYLITFTTLSTSQNATCMISTIDYV